MITTQNYFFSNLLHYALNRKIHFLGKKLVGGKIFLDIFKMSFFQNPMVNFFQGFRSERSELSLCFLIYIVTIYAVEIFDMGSLRSPGYESFTGFPFILLFLSFSYKQKRETILSLPRLLVIHF